MKELSIEEKAIAYDRVSKEVKDFFGGKQKMYSDVEQTLEYLFPELKESEDERIRKELIEYVKDQQSSFISAPDCRDKYEEEENNKYNAWIAWLEKQGREKPADNVESKFKVGDWISNSACTIQITSIDDKYYWHNNNHVGGDIESIDKQYHLWTIEDAKEGDVIAEDPIFECPSSFVAIYKKQNEEDFDSYCFVGFNGKFYKGENGHSTEYIHPATKEQRDLLFQKMKEAGYEWDAEKKELKKIKQKSWSEEDEKMCESVIDVLVNNTMSGSEGDKVYSEEIDWLKSLRGRYTWKPSDEQITVLELASKYERVFTPKQIDILIGLKEQLKKLKGK